MTRPQLTVIAPPETTACCAACAEAATPAATPEAPLIPVIQVEPARVGPIRRDDDRRVALVSVTGAAAFVAAAAAAAALGAGPWAPLHLLLAGAAATAIAGVLPFFASALATARPADPRLRLAAVALVAIGAAAVTARTSGAPPWVPAAGGLAFIAGMALVAWMTGSAARAGLWRRRPWVAVAYGAALVHIVLGAGLATLFVAGVAPVVAGWATLRPAHAWLNLVGFVSMVIVGTLLHLLPTVAGTRIVDRPSGRLAVAGLAGGVPLVTGGLVLATAAPAVVADTVARAGATLVLAGALGMAAETLAVARARGRWTTELGWHAIATGSLALGGLWFAVGMGLAAGRVLIVGASPDAWLTSLAAAPLAVGWVVQVLVGAWSHLVPAIGPGGPGGHAVRRAILGRASIPRLVTLNAGVLLLGLGWGAGLEPAVLPGALLVGMATLANLVLALAAVTARAAASPVGLRASAG